jgi:hypothetical protein
MKLKAFVVADPELGHFVQFQFELNHKPMDILSGSAATTDIVDMGELGPFPSVGVADAIAVAVGDAILLALQADFRRVTP